MVFTTIYSFYTYVSSPLGLTKDALQLTETKKISWDVLLYVLAWNWLFFTQYALPFLYENTPMTYTGLVLLIRKLYALFTIQAPSIWRYFTHLCHYAWEYLTSIAPYLWSCIFSLLQKNWKQMRGGTFDGWTVLTEKVTPVIYKDLSLALRTVSNDFWFKALPYMLPDLHKGFQRITNDLLDAYAFVYKSLGHMNPQIIFDLCVSLPRHVSKALLLGTSRIIQDLASEGLKKSDKIRRDSWELIFPNQVSRRRSRG